MSFRNRAPCSRSVATTASRSATSIEKRFQPPGVGSVPSGIACPPPPPPPGALEDQAEVARDSMANVGAGCITSSKPRCWQ